MKLVILDRDGVINHDSASYIKSPDEWKPIPGSLEAIARLTQSGYSVVVATNQSGIGRGLFEMATLNAIHDKMHRALAQLGGRIDALFYCPHAADAKCDCRKPKPGMIEEIGRLEVVGRPILYGVTDSFLQHFGLSSLAQLPPLADPDAELLASATQLAALEGAG